MSTPKNTMQLNLVLSPTNQLYIAVVDPNDPTDDPNGSDKRILVADIPIDYSQLQNVPATDWQDVTNKPSTFPSDWSTLGNIPSLLSSSSSATISGLFTFTKMPFYAYQDLGNVNADQQLDVQHYQCTLMRLDDSLALDYSTVIPTTHIVVVSRTNAAFNLTFRSAKWIHPAGITLGCQVGNFDILFLQGLPALNRWAVVSHIKDVVLN